jgi:hypothetical protein
VGGPPPWTERIAEAIRFLSGTQHCCQGDLRENGGKDAIPFQTFLYPPRINPNSDQSLVLDVPTIYLHVVIPQQCIQLQQTNNVKNKSPTTPTRPAKR